MTSERIGQHCEQLRMIVEQLKAEILQKDAGRADVHTRLRALALEVGAWPYTVEKGSRADASDDELVANIHQALQTAAMIDACRTAAKNHRTALIAAAVALVAALAAWAGVYVQTRQAPATYTPPAIVLPTETPGQ